MNIVIIGAGVAGLSIGWRLLQAGCGVTILERAQPAQGATWAAAGMLAVTAEMEDAAGPERQLARQSGALWPGFAAELEGVVGGPIGYVRSGSLLLAPDAAALEVMRARAGADPALTLLDRGGVEGLAPGLAGVVGGLHAADEAQVDSRLLGAALTEAFLRAGGHLLANEAAVRIDGRTVLTPYGRYRGDALVIAAGAWSGLLDKIPIAPVKGQVIALAPPPGAALPRPMLWGEDVYLVPREGRLLVGATVEEAGFDTGLTEAARRQLRGRAERLMPSLRDWTLADHWAGLRPRSADGLPLLGRLRDGVFVAGGQYRNGILFAPAMARIVTDMVLDRGQPDPAFDPRRFA